MWIESWQRPRARMISSLAEFDARQLYLGRLEWIVARQVEGDRRNMAKRSVTISAMDLGVFPYVFDPKEVGAVAADRRRRRVLHVEYAAQLDFANGLELAMA